MNCPLCSSKIKIVKGEYEPDLPIVEKIEEIVRQNNPTGNKFVDNRIATAIHLLIGEALQKGE